MPNDYNLKVAKKITAKYIIKDKEYSNIYLINAYEDQDMMTDVMLIVASYRMNDWTVDLSDPFVIPETLISTKADIIKDLVSSLDSLLSDEVTLNLTK